MSRSDRNLKERMGRDSASSLSAAGSPDSARAVVAGLMHRQGYLLAIIQEVVEGDLARRGMQEDLEVFRDNVNPIVDALLAFEFNTRRGDVQA